MTPRERVLAALSHREPDRVPREASFTPYLMEIFRQKTGATNPEEYFGMECRWVGFGGPPQKQDFTKWLPADLPAGTHINIYGVAHVPGSFHHFNRMVSPLKSVSRIEEFEDYPWPDITLPERHCNLEADVVRVREQGWFVKGSVGHIFENAWQIRGYENLMTDFVLNPELAAFILDKLTADRAFQARRYAEAGVDMIVLGDDVGMQDRLMMSVETWRAWLKPRMASVIQAARQIKPEIHVFYHSDGMIQPIIEDLIEIGIDVLNPIQPECMDPAEMKAEYGDRLSFWGTIGTQTTMPFGTPDEVRATIHERIRTVGKGGGLVLAPTHVLEPDVPWENVIAFFEAVDSYER